MTDGIVISAAGSDLDAAVDPRFGRCAYFLFVDPGREECRSFLNDGIGAAGGAGIQAAQFVARLRPAAVISGEFGPNALSALSAAGIRLYRHGDCATVRDALARI